MRARARVSSALTIMMLSAACSGPAPSSPAPAAEPAKPAATEPTPAPAPPPVVATPDAEGIVRLSASDQMRFNATRIEVKAGDKIRIELTNAGTLPKEAMGHNLIVLKPGSDPMAFAVKAASAKDTDYAPAGAEEMLGHLKLLGPGEKAVLELDALAAGSYPYLCSFPGHVGLMNGLIVVQ